MGYQFSVMYSTMVFRTSIFSKSYYGRKIGTQSKSVEHVRCSFWFGVYSTNVHLDSITILLEIGSTP